jgi:hypothetical protein
MAQLKCFYTLNLGIEGSSLDLHSQRGSRGCSIIGAHNCWVSFRGSETHDSLPTQRHRDFYSITVSYCTYMDTTA